MSSDRNLLFGVLALQMDFINRDDLIAGVDAWIMAKDKPLGDLLREQGRLSDSNLQLLNALVEAHVKAHQGDVQRSLERRGVSPPVLALLRGVRDPELEASLVSLGSAKEQPVTVVVNPGSGQRYQILRPHAKGGLGEVFVALDSELNREVALKEIQLRHADDAHSRDRFVLEAEITGGLEHPGIIPVYGSNKYADGRPYYVMRFIRGDNLREAIRRFHCAPDDRERRGVSPPVGERPVSGGTTGGLTPRRSREVRFDSLDFRALLRRFLDVCNAIAYAHSRGVLHRDLKPGNIMLGKFGETLVVDWGLAKPLTRLTSPDRQGGIHPDDDETMLRPTSGSGLEPTQAGTALGTPPYMSPEQAAGRLDQLSCATDIYSLGATLFTVLTNRPPIEGTDVGEMLRKVQAGEVGFSCGASFQLAVEKASWKLAPQPLIAICKKAMSLRPAERYASPLDLAQDLEHWLADEPVSAYREPVFVQAMRFVRKRKALVTSAAATLLVATIGSIVASLLLTAKNNQLASANANERAARAEAQTEAATATAVKDFLRFDLLQLAAASQQQEQAATGVKMDPDLKVRDLVLRAAQKIEGKFPDQPLVEAEIRWTLGWTLDEIGRADLAIPQFLRVRELYTAKLGPDHPNTLASMHNLAISYAAAGRTQEALKLKEETLQFRKAKLGPDHPDTLRSMMNLANSYFDAGRTPEALTLHEETLQLKKTKLGPDHPDTLASMNNLASSYFAAGRTQEALKLFEETLQLMKAKLGPDHPDTLASMNNLAASYADAGRTQEALKLKEETLQLMKAKLGPDHPDTLRSMNNLANSYADAGRTQEALKLYEETLQLRKAKLGPDHPDTLQSMNNLANSYIDLGRAAEAVALLQQTLAIRTRQADAQPGNSALQSYLAWTHGQMGQAEQARHDFAAAVTAYAKSVAMFEKLDQAGALKDPFFRGRLNRYRQRLALCRKAEQAVRDLDVALAQPAAEVPGLLDLRVRFLLKERQKPGFSEKPGFFLDAAVETAAKMKELAGDKADRLYDAACLYALCAGAKKPVADASGSYSDKLAEEAMALLKQAVAKGYKDAGHMKQDKDLDALREREDFKKLLGELEGPMGRIIDGLERHYAWPLLWGWPRF